MTLYPERRKPDEVKHNLQEAADHEVYSSKTKSSDGEEAQEGTNSS